MTYVEWTHSFSQCLDNKQNNLVGRNTLRVSKRMKWITTLNQGLYVATLAPSNLTHFKSWETKNKKRHHNLTLRHRTLCLGDMTLFCVWGNFVHPKIKAKTSVKPQTRPHKLIPRWRTREWHLINQKDRVSQFISLILLWTRVQVIKEHFFSLIFCVNGN